MTRTVPHKHAATAAVVAIAVAGLAGCTSSRAGSDGPPPTTGKAAAVSRHVGGTLTVLDNDTIQTLEPGTAYGSSTYQVIFAVSRPLYDYAPGKTYNGVVPDLAVGPPVVAADAKTVTVHLHDDVHFSAPVNRVVTSADVKYAFERGFSENVGTPYASTYFGSIVGAPAQPTKGPRDISGILTPNPTTLVFALTKPVGALVAGALVLPITVPVPQSYAAAFDKENPSTYGDHLLATGPYMIPHDATGKLTGFKPHVSVTLVRNPAWSGSTDKRPAYLDSIVINETASNSTLASKEALGGTSTVANEPVPASVLATSLTTRAAQLFQNNPPQWNVIAFNTAKAPLSNLDVRRAIVAAVDRISLRKLYGGPSAGPLQTHYLAPGIPGYAEAGGAAGPKLDFMAHPNGDLALAHSYLVKAGYPNGRLSATLTYPITSDPVDQRVGQFVTQQLARLGITVKTSTVSNSTFETECGTIAEQPSLCEGIAIADFGDPEAQLELGFDGNDITPTDDYNYSQLNDPAVNAAISKADLVPPGEARNIAWANIDRMITADAPSIPENYGQQFYAASSNVAGVVTSAVGIDLTRTSLT